MLNKLYHFAVTADINWYSGNSCTKIEYWQYNQFGEKINKWVRYAK